MLEEIEKKLKRNARHAWNTARWGRSGAILVNSIPKSGTHLLLNVIYAIPGARAGSSFLWQLSRPDSREPQYLDEEIRSFRTGDVHAGHIPYSAEIAAWLDEHEVRQVFIYRDPRDVTVSLWRYIMKPGPERHPFFEMYNRFGSKS